MINGLLFISLFFAIVSFDVLCGFALYLLWKFLDLKYFSTSEIEMLREENKYLKEQNIKVNGSASFWEDKG